MSHYNAHGTSFKCISSLELQEIRDWALDAFGSERLLTDQRLIRLLDALEAAQHHIEVIEEAALIRAGKPQTALPLVTEMFAHLRTTAKDVGASTMVAGQTVPALSVAASVAEPTDDEPARLQKIGAI